MDLLEQFRSFYFQNYPQDMENAIELFSIFGGLDISIDTTAYVDSLVYEHILSHYKSLNTQIEQLLESKEDVEKVLFALSKGDRRIFSIFKKARLNNQNGGIALGFLQQKGIIKIEHSREEDKRKFKPKLKKEEAKHRISDKFFISYPFLRFWFYFIYPHRKEIEKKEYEPFFQQFHREFSRYISLVFEELSSIFLDYYLQDKQIESIGSYWDANVEIDVYIVTKSAEIYVAECKWTNHKINKKELNKLLEKCQQLNITPAKVILFSKRGFSKELYQMQGKMLQLFDVNDFVLLVRSKPQNLSFPLAFG